MVLLKFHAAFSYCLLWLCALFYLFTFTVLRNVVCSTMPARRWCGDKSQKAMPPMTDDSVDSSHQKYFLLMALNNFFSLHNTIFIRILFFLLLMLLLLLLYIYSNFIFLSSYFWIPFVCNNNSVNAIPSSTFVHTTQWMNKKESNQTSKQTACVFSLFFSALSLALSLALHQFKIHIIYAKRFQHTT